MLVAALTNVKTLVLKKNPNTNVTITVFLKNFP